MRVDVITLFPEFVGQLREFSIVGRAMGEKKIEFVVHNLRDWSKDNYGSVDGRVYGGGPGMLIRVDVVAEAIAAVKKTNKGKVILLSPQGEVYEQKVARELVKQEGVILVCGHYEGFDERVREYVDLEISIGDYVLTGGELAAMVVVDSIVRLLPGVLGDDKSSNDESFEEGLLEYPQYTRPEKYDGKEVPAVLLSGHHGEIGKWRREEAKKRTRKRRPDLLR